MRKGQDLSNGDPVVKDPPLHRLHNWMTTGWNLYAVAGLWLGWGAAISLITLTLTNAISGWTQKNQNGYGFLALGCLIGLIMLAVTIGYVYYLEEAVIEKRWMEEQEQRYRESWPEVELLQQRLAGAQSLNPGAMTSAGNPLTPTWIGQIP